MNSLKKCDNVLYMCINGKIYIVDVNKITYIEHQCRRIRIHLLNKEIIEIQYMSLKKITKIVECDFFLRCHKAYVVNIKLVCRIDRTNNLLYLKENETPVPIGRKYKSGLLDCLHLAKKGSV